MKLMLVVVLLCSSVLAMTSVQLASKEILSNSSWTPLPALGSFTGVGEGSLDGNSIVVNVTTDKAGSLFIQQSTNNLNWDVVSTYLIQANENSSHRATLTAKYFRVKFTNTESSAQTYFRLQTILGNQSFIAAPLNRAVAQTADTIMVRSFSEERMIASGFIGGYSIVNRFGFNPDIDNGQSEDVWEHGGDYTGFPGITPELVAVSSSDANDSSAGTGCRSITIFGLDADFNSKNENIALNGLSNVSSVGTYSRVFRVQCLTAGSALINVGDVTAKYATTASVVFARMAAGKGNSQGSFYTIPAGHTGYLISYTVQLNAGQNQGAGVAIKIIPSNQAMRQAREFFAHSGIPFRYDIYGGIRFSEKTDFVFRIMSAGSNNQSASVTWDMILVKN